MRAKPKHHRQSWTSGARSANDDEEPVVRMVNERTTYEKRDTTGSGPGAVSMCDYRLEVTTATSVEVGSWALGNESSTRPAGRFTGCRPRWRSGRGLGR